MIPYPATGFHIGGVGEIRPDSPLWHLPLSERAFDFPRREAKPAGNFQPPITIGDYLLAARRFLFNDGCSILDRAFLAQTGTPLGCRYHPVSLSLSLEKHGLFYHPVKVTIKNHERLLCALVLNGAVSEPGLALVEKECLLLSEISGQVPLSVFPRVYGYGSVGWKNSVVGFFLGEWFQEFCEFHVSKCKGEPCISVWDDRAKNKRFTLDEAARIYESIAFVLTVAYNLETGQQIFPWHHAAGDFIVHPGLVLNPPGDALAIRLISVRGYDLFASMAGGGRTPGAALLTALLVFFLNLCLRMQLDKVDGIGETVFLGEAVLRATILGFFRGLDVKAGVSGYEDLNQAFFELLKGFSQDQLVLMLENILEAQKNEAREGSVIQKNLKAHCRSLYDLFKTESVQDFY